MDQQLIAAHGQTAAVARMSAHGSKICRVNMPHGAPGVFAKAGSMIAYEGFVQMNPHRESLGRRFHSAVTGEGPQLMECVNQGGPGDPVGDLYLADYGADVAIMQLNGDSLSVNGGNILAFDTTMQWDIKRVPGLAAKFSGSGLFNVEISGHGWVAITTRGTPVVLDPAERETYVDPDALVAWTTALRMKTKSSMRLGAAIGRGTGEAVQVAFTGTGYVVVQPAEDATDRFRVRG